MTNVETGRVETGQEKTNNELNELKKEMIERIINKMKEKNKDDIFLSLGKDLVADYLLDEGESNDIINDFFLGVGIDLFSESADNLKDFREKIRNSNTKEELETLEKSIIENLNNSGDNQTKTGTSRSSGNTPSSGSTSSESSSGSTSSESVDSSETDTSTESAEVGEAVNVPKNKKSRLKRLFPKGKPENEKEMRKYIKTIKVPIIMADGKKEKMNLSIHKKLAKEIKAIFQEMYDNKIPVNPKSTSAFNWRDVRGRKGILSDHCWGGAIDVNASVNRGDFGKVTDPTSPYYNGKKTVEIRKKHGFARGGDWKTRNDPMHFTYTLG